MANNIIYDKFEEVEDSIRRDAPPVVYKYRDDWNSPYHKALLTERKAWFSAPRDLDDPNDIRVPLKFNVAEIDHPRFFEKMVEYFLESRPGLIATDSEINRICENRMDMIRENPNKYFQETYEQIRQGDIFDRVGVFSCTSLELEPTMWQIYGGHHQGFSVGFHTVELARSFLCGCGKAKYDDEVPEWSFINEIQIEDVDTFYLKSTKWKYQEEFRFYKMQDNIHGDRSLVFSKEAIKEVLIGAKTPDDIAKDIVKTVRNLYGNAVEIFDVVLTNYGLDKFKVDENNN